MPRYGEYTVTTGNEQGACAQNPESSDDRLNEVYIILSHPLSVLLGLNNNTNSTFIWVSKFTESFAGNETLTARLVIQYNGVLRDIVFFRLTTLCLL